MDYICPLLKQGKHNIMDGIHVTNAAKYSLQKLIVRGNRKSHKARKLFLKRRSRDREVLPTYAEVFARYSHMRKISCQLSPLLKLRQHSIGTMMQMK
jgi:hypothetical protein